MQNLNDLKLEELTREELVEIEGGKMKWWEWLLIGLAIKGLAGEAVFKRNNLFVKKWVLRN
jgi:hypothetical protein